MRQTATWLGVGLVLTTSMLAGACQGDESESPTPTTTTATTAAPTSTPTATPTATPSLEEEVSAAYLAYWDAYAEALLQLDVSLVQDAAVGEELERIASEIADLESDGVALRVVVEHDFTLVSPGTESAVVVDEYVDKSFYVDPTTKDPRTADVPGVVTRDSFEMVRTETGTWAVASSRRLE